mgnify:CR=1 FL=1
MFIGIDPTYIKSGVELNISIIKTVFMMLCIFYTNYKITDKKIEINFKFIGSNLTIIMFGIILGVIKKQVNLIIWIMSTIMIISILYPRDRVIKSIVATVVSFAINYTISYITIVISFIFYLFNQTFDNYVNLIVILISHLTLLYLLFKIKRFKKGFSFLKSDDKNEYLDILVLNISIITMLLISILIHSDLVLARELMLGIATAIFIMFATIKKSLQLYYKQKLLIQDLNETKEELEKTKNDLKQVEEENLGLSKKSHSIAHKQKALEYKMQQLLMNTEIGSEQAGEVQDRIREIQKDLYKDKATIELIKTEIPKIDDMLEYMQSECIKNKIEFELQISGNIHYMVNNLIAKEDLEILLADHIKDAIIAINHTDNINRSILVRLGEIDGIYSLYIYDSGIEFEKETLSKLGKSPITTHASEGGTGMGFMNTFDTLKKYQASLTINELSEPNKDNYTKVLIFRFDKKNEFNIISYRQ